MSTGSRRKIIAKSRACLITYSATMIKFLHFDFLAVSYRIQRKDSNAVYGFLISLLVPEIFKFEKLVKYAN